VASAAKGDDCNVSFENHRTSVIPVKERLIVALDVASVDEAKALVGALGDHVCFYKIGMQLQFGGGLEYAKQLMAEGKKVFLDAKLFDIDETIERAVENVAAMGVDFLTVHGNKKTIPAAVRGRGNSRLKIFCVTLLTSLDSHDMADIYGEGANIADFVAFRATKAIEAGADGVIASGHEAKLIRELVSNIKVVDSPHVPQDAFKIITPGIRLEGSASDDQKRVMTPGDAIVAGADYLVVGRPINKAEKPAQAAEQILLQIEAALRA
jgi:orotidine-5'-phosphate decarboxylase